MCKLALGWQLAFNPALRYLLIIATSIDHATRTVTSALPLGVATYKNRIIVRPSPEYIMAHLLPTDYNKQLAEGSCPSNDAFSVGNQLRKRCLGCSNLIHVPCGHLLDAMEGSLVNGQMKWFLHHFNLIINVTLSCAEKVIYDQLKCFLSMWAMRLSVMLLGLS